MHGVYISEKGWDSTLWAIQKRCQKHTRMMDKVGDRLVSLIRSMAVSHQLVTIIIYQSLSIAFKIRAWE